jgi:hypothetical protein
VSCRSKYTKIRRYVEGNHRAETLATTLEWLGKLGRKYRLLLTIPHCTRLFEVLVEEGSIGAREVFRSGKEERPQVVFVLLALAFAEIDEANIFCGEAPFSVAKDNSILSQYLVSVSD